ncbi:MULTISPECIES: PLD nuclease N-terminal domain-containing protein [Halobacillus]|uniref:PLD nuclease N-terminal domain-containing protein n=1 Tax=Halobacillus TaxID=45667 RepID=UPI0003FA84CA|nr:MULTISPECIES: PLD nuclease N-terminal domain-containing protein [Halobacillus]
MSGVVHMLTENLPVLLPLVVIQIILMAAALISLTRTKETRGPKWMWVLLIIFVNTLGPVAYFIFGRSEER